MKMKIHAALLAGVMSVGALFTAAAPAHASKESTWRGLTYGLGGVTAYGAVRRSPTIALLGAAGTAYSYSRWRHEIKNRHRRYGYRRHARHRYYRYHR